MVICKFFMQGSCRYGNNCWNDHPSGGNQGYSVSAQRQLFGGGNKGGGGGGGGGGRGQQSQVTFGQNRFKWIAPDQQQQQQQQQQNRGGGGTSAAQLSTADIVSALAAEVKTMFEDGKMWPFTCIGFEKDLPSLPGFDDLSMEEIRLEAYEAQKTGSFQQFGHKFLSLVNDVMTKRQELKAPSMTMKQKLFIDDARKKGSSGSSSQTSLFSGPGDKELFGGGSSGGLFGSSQTSGQASSGLFAHKDQTSTFGQSGQTSLFGQAPSFGQSASTFGQQSSFGQSGLFGQSGQTSTGQMFGQSTGQSGFGQTSTIFGQQTSQPLSTFGQPQTPKTSLFGKSDSPLKSASFQTPSSATGNSQTFFGTPTGAQSSSQSAAPVSNLFGGAVAPTGIGFGTSVSSVPKQAVQAEPEDSAYTAVDKLTVEEMEQFRAPTFTLGQIPTKPPPRELCF